MAEDLHCSICGSRLCQDEEDEGICLNCQSSMVESDIL